MTGRSIERPERPVGEVRFPALGIVYPPTENRHDVLGLQIVPSSVNLGSREYSGQVHVYVFEGFNERKRGITGCCGDGDFDPDVPSP